MNLKSLSKRGRTALVSVVIVVASAGSAWAAFTSVYGPDETFYFFKYEQHAANWWTWALAQPADKSPLIDTTGANCQQGQSIFTPFFLAGTFDGAAVTRSCTISRRRTILFPVINAATLVWPKDPAYQHEESWLREQTLCMTEGAELFAEVDGEPIENVEDFLEFSNNIVAFLPRNNVYGITRWDERFFNHGTDTGYYIAIKPNSLSVGTHTLHFGGTTSCGFSQDNTYILTITK